MAQASMASILRNLLPVFCTTLPRWAGMVVVAYLVCPLPETMAQNITNEDLLLRGITDNGGLSDAQRRRLLRAAERIGDGEIRAPERNDTGPVQPVQTGGSVNPPTQPLTPQAGRREEQDPYAPVGIRVGTFVLRPTVTQQIAHENSDDGTAVTDRTYSRTVLEVEIDSDWSRHQLNIGAEQVIDKTISGTGPEDPSTAVNADLRLDLTSTTTADINFEYRFGRDDQFDPNAIAGADSQAEVHEFRGAASLTHQFGSWRGRATIAGGRIRYGDAELPGGVLVSQSDRNADDYAATLRATLETGSAYQPFLQGSFGQTIYDRQFDFNGFERSSDDYDLRAGVIADFGEKLTGEFAIGYALRDIEDPRLRSIEGVTVNGFASWSPQRGTDVLMGLSTSLEDSTIADESGSIYYAATAEVDHQMRSNVVARISGLVGWRDYVGSTPNETVLGAGAGVTWWLNRNLALEAGATYEKTTSDTGTDNDDLFIGVGLKLQR
ncbi:MAG: outer membrane beta-barrel protein [Pseudomonadota bacterium]